MNENISFVIQFDLDYDVDVEKDPVLSALETPSLDMLASNASSIATNWEAPDMSDYQLTPSAADSAKTPSHIQGIPWTPERSESPKESVSVKKNDPIVTKKVQTAYEAAAARAKEAKLKEAQRKEEVSPIL